MAAGLKSAWTCWLGVYSPAMVPTVGDATALAKDLGTIDLTMAETSQPGDLLVAEIRLELAGEVPGSASRCRACASR
jgi:hypothetical protein